MAVQAADWPKRDRRHGWPSASYITRMLTTLRCRSCAHWDHKRWHLSVSALLFKSGDSSFEHLDTQIQQMIYCLLRYIIGKIVTSHSKHISNYHIKTLMMWSCERNQNQWWTSESLVGVCSELLKSFCSMHETGQCFNYFVEKCNYWPWCYFHENEIKQLQQLSNKLQLADWLVNIISETAL